MLVCLPAGSTPLCFLLVEVVRAILMLVVVMMVVDLFVFGMNMISLLFL